MIFFPRYVDAGTQPLACLREWSLRLDFHALHIVDVYKLKAGLGGYLSDARRPVGTVAEIDTGDFKRLIAIRPEARYIDV